MVQLAQDDLPSLPTMGTDLAVALADLERMDTSCGFAGSVSNLTLPDVIQLEGQNRFSGSILVLYQDQEGQIFFQDGEIVHAEAGSHSGEAAFNRILGWPGGSFHLHPNVTSLRTSIQKHREHLLLSAHQWLDESRLAAPPPPPAPEPAPASRAEDILQIIRTVPGVAHAVLMGLDGGLRGDAGAAGEALGAKGFYLVTQVAGPIGEALRLGDLQAAATHAEADRVLLFKAKGTYLTVGLAPGVEPEDAEAGIKRALLARKGAR
ncbi:MAG TPA: DUF4388 domain-containing protein [Holophagaceae bacterium]|nr:DUF4388 domain-containing protein [Holophagaceae bacterium]